MTIGIGFHWERSQVQKFAGSLKFIVDDGKVVAVNVVGVEDYLLSVISSEMKATASLEFLKAHAVISRSWLMARIQERRDNVHSSGSSVKEDRIVDGDYHLVKWFGRDDHKAFDVCADDHCQRYQGLTVAVGDNVRKAVDQTWGEVLTYDGEICDARFSKCCGGMMERFGSCWEDIDYPYLAAVSDTPSEEKIPDLTREDNARKWIMGEMEESSDAFCNTEDGKILAQVLNDYDLETKDFFRWEVRYTRKKLSELIASRSGHDIGMLESIEPRKRGPSGRITLLEIRGTKSSMTVGKELVIRKFLSASHLKSSAFVVDVLPSGTSFEEDIVVMHGAGWGHGVGLCQIGAAVMSSRGYRYRDILSHYYPGSICSVRRTNNP